MRRKSNEGIYSIISTTRKRLLTPAIAHAVDRERAYFDSIKAQDTDPLDKVELMIDGMVEYAVQRGCKAC